MTVYSCFRTLARSYRYRNRLLSEIHRIYIYTMENETTSGWFRLRIRLAEFLHIRGILPSITVRPNMRLYAKLSAYATRSLLRILKFNRCPPIERQNNIRTLLRTSFLPSRFNRIIF